MIRSTFLYVVVLGSEIASAIAGNTPQLNEVCQQIAATTSDASGVYDILSVNYESDISHWASSSTQLAACSFEPGTVEDVSKALQILGQTRTPFAVKGGGHSANPGFSSTLGVHITMTRFSGISYDSTAQTVDVGAGLLWDDVYMALEPYGVNVVGAKVSGVGVAGLALGGGYSWLTNQYGLTVDTVQAYELVMPNGTIIDVTESTRPDLFFALKGGFNNFGIVTKFTLKTFPQTQVWGGVITYTGDVLDQVNKATANFAANNNDLKAGILTTYNNVLGLVPSATLLVFYDAPLQPVGVFDEFLAIPSLAMEVFTRSFLSLVRSQPGNATYGTRGIFNTVSIASYSLSMIDSIVNETVFWGEKLALASVVAVSYDVEPIQTTLFDHSTTPSAYPPSRTRGFLPLNIYYSWLSYNFDDVFHDAIRTSASTLKQEAINSGQDIANAALYPNDAIFDTPLVDLYGANLPRLQAIKAAVDPDNVMGLAGGFKL